MSGTEKQTTARKRNWDIMRLRGIWANLTNISYNHRLDCDTACDAIDKMLIDMGAESESTRRKRMREELERKFQ